MDIQKILVPTDFSACAQHALTKAVDLAERFDATLHVLHVVDELDPEFYGIDDAQKKATQIRARIREEAQDRLNHMVPDGESIEIDTAVSVHLSFDVAATIHDYIEENGIDLVVMGTHGHRNIERLMLGNVADKLVRHARCPVITVNEEVPWIEGEKGRIVEEVLAPVDFSEHSKQAVRVAKEFADVYGATLHLLFVAEKRTVPTFSDTGLPGVGVVEMDEEIVANADKALRQLSDSVGGPDVPITTAVKHGRVAESVIDYAETEGTQLIVMATRGLSGVERFLLGSNTERIVRVAQCPVLTMLTEKTEEAKA
ncbi:universal stress protein [Longibacter salinarum]|uniref:Universal stress protein n=1 Tax=Longibacter salinarum TaxID=1850348 RepID=A0A2A8D2W9_9BACT|nr:universal stress protein [Longibacter salinarum]PEN15214.1 universal stress protein [Longibacter salinarum]